MTNDEYQKAVWQVKSANWVEPSQGDRSGWYVVTLKCGHTLKCLHHELHSYMFCLVCFNAT
jgi:hypothetical protein